MLLFLQRKRLALLILTFSGDTIIINIKSRKGKYMAKEITIDEFNELVISNKQSRTVGLVSREELSEGLGKL